MEGFNKKPSKEDILRNANEGNPETNGTFRKRSWRNLKIYPSCGLSFYDEKCTWCFLLRVHQLIKEKPQQAYQMGSYHK